MHAKEDRGLPPFVRSGTPNCQLIENFMLHVTESVMVAMPRCDWLKFYAGDM